MGTLVRLIGPRLHVFDARFARQRWRYLAQTLLATLTLAVVLLLEDALANVAVITGIASSAVIVFVNPRTAMAHARRVIGGHVLAVLVALPISYLLYDSALSSELDAVVTRDIAAAIGVGITVLVMALFDMEHAPAAGTVLGLVLVPWEWEAALFVIVAAAILSAVRTTLGRRLIDMI
jgi:hypothetical protein